MGEPESAGRTVRAATGLGPRGAGVLLHPTSLPGPGGCGALGAEARRFVDWLAGCGVGVWQVLPLGPPDADCSPYRTPSVHAGDPRLVCPLELAAEGWLSREQAARWNAGHAVADRTDLVDAARRACASGSGASELEAFVEAHAGWLEDWTLYRVLKTAHGERAWWTWPRALRARDPAALAEARRVHAAAIARERFVQFLFHRQWAALKRYANARGVRLFGDLPIFAADDSADVWSAQQYFRLKSNGRPTVVAGVPPDYFSKTGQRWGNPHYDWARMEADGFAWWCARLRSQLALFDLLRIDHFRGFEAFWEIPAAHRTARKGRWVPAPGAALFAALEHEFGALPIVAEDLGVITPQVTALRERFGLPGMRVVQFAFDGDPANPHLPANHVPDCVAYTGTHDNDTTAGWFAGLEAAERERVLETLGVEAVAMPWALAQATLASRAGLAVLPLQDVLGLGSEHRLNTPGVSHGNWRWRFRWDWIREAHGTRLRELVAATARAGGRSAPVRRGY